MNILPAFFENQQMFLTSFVVWCCSHRNRCPWLSWWGCGLCYCCCGCWQRSRQSCAWWCICRIFDCRCRSQCRHQTCNGVNGEINLNYIWESDEGASLMFLWTRDLKVRGDFLQDAIHSSENKPDTIKLVRFCAHCDSLSWIFNFLLR